MKTPIYEPSLSFSLRHQHAIANDSRVFFADVPPSLTDNQHVLKFRNIQMHRPRSYDAFTAARTNALLNMETDAELWVKSTIPAPNVEDRETLLTLAKMTNNAYFGHSSKDWYPLEPYWGNISYPFGWEPDADGFRGYIFVSEDNSTVVLSVKGTSAGWLVGDGGPTVKKDKLNDNLLFSCCCATFGVPVVAFEAPGEKLAASRLHLPSQPSTHHITHVYHTADPIPMGVCTGITSACAIGGCHLGKVIKYDTVGKWNWTVDVRTHSIVKVIESILAEDWELPSEGNPGRQVPELGDEDGCIDCYNWEYGDYSKRLSRED
ncbi:hypothetical protein EW145_g2524 [Phellinidium pouzarii]|uniref:triacylglycerol lipase n=1 Tax=Phellinidium pouzarii TaxID=167371 RepID=A0A4S4LAI5_9AGAM|nr:hypothetical protein EW145_g2524 [Phellinidium pouzarii]